MIKILDKNYNRACKRAVKVEKKRFIRKRNYAIEKDFRSNCSHDLFKIVRDLGKKIEEKAYGYEG